MEHLGNLKSRLMTTGEQIKYLQPPMLLYDRHCLTDSKCPRLLPGVQQIVLHRDACSGLRENSYSTQQFPSVVTSSEKPGHAVGLVFLGVMT